MIDIERIKHIGTKAAYKSGEILKSLFGQLHDVRKKGAIDLVTEADVRSEAAIIETLTAAFPDHAILAEESGRHPGTSENCWIIDPLDGTTNFAHHLPLFCVSIGFSKNDELLAGFVLAPILGEFFMAIRGQGAMRNGVPITVSDTRAIGDSLLVTGFPYNHAAIFSPLMERFGRCLAASQGIRRLGSAALDLCYVASGRFDGFWEELLHPWDTAAGVLIAEEAGAQTTVFSGKPYSIYNDQIVTTNGKIHGQLLQLLDLSKPVAHPPT